MKLFSAEAANRQVLVLDYCHPDGTCNRVVTFICDTAHNELIILITYYDCGWDTLKGVFHFDAKLTGLHLGYKLDAFGLYLFFDSPIATRQDYDNITGITKIWRDGYFDGVADYELVRTEMPAPTSEKDLQNAIWIGDDMYYAPRN